MHMEKVSAILNLEFPKTTHNLQIFLGMMVYFSAYIPFYTWIAAPSFNLLKKDNKWEWTKISTKAFEPCKQILTNARFEDMQFLDHLTNYIPTLVIMDLLPYFNKSRKFN